MVGAFQPVQATFPPVSSPCFAVSGLTNYNVRLVGVRTVGSGTVHVTQVSDKDTVLIDGVFTQPGMPYGCTISVDITVFVTPPSGLWSFGCVRQSANTVTYAAPVQDSLNSQPSHEGPPYGTWVTLYPPYPPPPGYTPPSSKSALGSWCISADGAVTLSDSAGSYTIITHDSSLTDATSFTMISA